MRCSASSQRKCSVNKQKIPLTPLQLGLSLLSAAGLIFCAAGDIIMLLFDRGTINRTVVVTNLALSMIIGIAATFLVLHTGVIKQFDSDVQGDKLPAIQALRTFFCMLETDMALTLLLMMMGMVFWTKARLAILIATPVIFIASGAFYLFRTGRMGRQEASPEDEEADQNKDNAAAER